MTVLATPPKFVLYQGNTQVIQLFGLQDFLTGAYLNAATVTGTLEDAAGNIVAGANQISFTFVPASNGDYNGVFGDDTFDPPEGPGYTLIVDALQAGSWGHWEFIVEIKVRQQ